MTKFYRFELRTTDAAAARAFYARLFEHDRSVVWPLHEQALARGARPHWLGHLGVANLEPSTAAFVERGATKLGPTPPIGDGDPGAVLRDPGGAVVALSTPPPANRAAAVNVAWHVLNTNDAARATENYCQLFGWEATENVDWAAVGAFRQFAWSAGGPSVGVIADIAARPGVHPHWLFVFEVGALDAAVAMTRAAGGVVLDPFVLPGGERLFVCDDPQGAAFALCERRS
jgi:predicted enzyme related to lactoylglutathione lyase